MRNLFVATALAAALTLAPLTANAQENWSNLGVQGGLFIPTDGEIRDAFGSSLLSFGLGATSRQEFKQRSLRWDWNVISADKNGNRVFILTPSVGFVFPLGDATGVTRPYWAVRGGVAYMDYSVDTGDERVSGSGIVFNGNAELGVSVSDRLNLSLRYDLFGERDGLNFNGLSLNLTYGFLRL